MMKIIITLSDALVTQALSEKKYYDFGFISKPSRAGFSKLDIKKLPHLQKLEIKGDHSGMYYFSACYKDQHEITLKHLGGPDEDSDTEQLTHNLKEEILAEAICNVPYHSGRGRTLRLYGDGDSVRHYLAPLAVFGVYDDLTCIPKDYSSNDIKKALTNLEFRVTQRVVPVLAHLHSPSDAIIQEKSAIFSRRLREESNWVRVVQEFEFEYTQS